MAEEGKETGQEERREGKRGLWLGWGRGLDRKQKKEDELKRWEKG